MEITQATPRDIPAVWRLVCACRDNLRYRGIHQWDELYPNERIVIDDVNSRSVYVMQQSNVCVAAVTLNEQQDPAWQHIQWAGGEPALVIHRLCVLPEHQGAGNAARLMDFAEARAAQFGYAGIRLDAYSGNPAAVGLYERRGYRKAGQVNYSRCSLPAVCFEKLIPRPLG